MTSIFRGARGGAVLAVALSLSAAALLGQDFHPPPAKAPDAATLKAIREKTTRLAKALRDLRKQDVGDALLADVEIYHAAAAAIVRHNEFFQPDSAAWTLKLLDHGLQRAKQMAKADMPWLKTEDGVARTVARGYRSRIDNSAQPFAVTYPDNYDAGGKKWRVDMVLHGRDTGLTEVKFLHAHDGRKPPEGQAFVRIDIYGRGNNAYRWAGETDVLEVMEQFLATERALRRDKYLDPHRWVLRGFSMGGAGTWHLGLHRPDAWCVLGPGAGFTATHGYVAKLPARLPAWQESCLRIYDAVDYAENAFNVPIVAYGGAKDPQLQAARNIEARLKPLGLPVKLQVLVAPDLAHKFPPEWQQKAEAAYAPFVAKGRAEYPRRVRFVTYTLKYPSCDWVRILALGKHYERALVDAEKTEDGFKVTTANVTTLRLTAPQGVLQDLTVVIDGQEVTARPWGVMGGPASVYLKRKGDRWTAVLPQLLITERSRRPQKGIGLQGPIDDAFTDAFLCVRGTGKPWHEATERYADANLRRFRDEWSKYWRGELPLKDDTDVTSEDLTDKHLILFGDPSSNSLIGHVLDGLPLRWTKDTIEFAGKQYPAGAHVPVLIYPSPLNSTRYIVLNSGHTFHTADYVGTNALLYPRLGDYAVLRLATTPQDSLGVEVATAGLFDEYWQIPKGGQ
jgi:dienelactone hydrolase